MDSEVSLERRIDEGTLLDTVIEVERLLDLASYELDSETLFMLGEMLYNRRAFGDCDYGCLKKGGTGVWCWLKSRMIEYGMFKECGGKSEIDERLTVELHFYPWDEEKYGPWANDREIVFEDIMPNVARSPLSRIADASPVNKVARKVIQNNDHNCPYCKRYFRNPVALGLHIRDFHGCEEFEE